MKHFISIFTFAFCLHLCYAQETITLDSTSAFQIGKSIEYYIPQQEVGIREVYNADFSKFKEDVPNLGIHEPSIWIKFSLINKSSFRHVVLNVDNPTLTEAELFQKTTDDNFESILLNKLLPITSRKHKVSDYSFWIENLEKNHPTEYYLRIKSDQPIILPININLPPDELNQVTQKNWVNGIYFGIIIAMTLYNLFLFISVGDKSYLYYVLFISSAGLTQLTLKGISYQYFWPSYPFLESYGMIFLASASGIFSLMFTNNFLHLRNSFPKFERILILLSIPFGISIILLFMGNSDLSFTMMRLNTAFSAISIFLITIFVVKKRKGRSDIYFLISWSFLILGSLIYILYNYGILPYNLFTNYSVQLTSAIEMILLSFALASRINLLKKEKEVAQMNALEMAHENSRIIKEQNIELEKNVTKRTLELHSKNSELEESLQQLKRAQTKLVAAEKMSSLGQLTAGIAHEINNPINFVAANVNPLKRDIHQLFDTIQQIEEICQKDISKAEKESQVAAFKEEQDFDYLKIEIRHLLKGIQEGASRTAEIVKGLRTFSRLDEDDFKSIDLNAGLEATLSITHNLLKGVELIKDFGEIPLVECYPGKLNQVFLNIITNAIFAIQKKHGINEGGTLIVKTYQEDDLVCISIKDDGVGMSEETKEKLFEPFFTTKEVGEGTGLGMSIAFAIIKQHQAQLFIHSSLGEGTEFLLKVPIENDEVKNREDFI